MRKEYDLVSSEAKEFTYVFNQSYRLLSPYVAMLPKSISTHETFQRFVYDVCLGIENRQRVEHLFTHSITVMLLATYEAKVPKDITERLLFVLHLYKKLPIQSVRLDDYETWQVNCFTILDNMSAEDIQNILSVVLEEVEAMVSFGFLYE